MQLRYDSKFGAIVTPMLGQYVNFRARKTFADKSISGEGLYEIGDEILHQIKTIVGSNNSKIIMVLLLTKPKQYELDVLLYPIFERTHEMILRQRDNSFPKFLVVILTVLFYKHWLQMCTTNKDKEEFTKKALQSLKLNFGKYIPFQDEIPKKCEVITRGFDDKVKQFMHYSRASAWYDYSVLF